MTLKTGHPLRMWRASQEMTGVELAALAGVSDNVIYHVETWGHSTQANYDALTAVTGVKIPQPALGRGNPNFGERGYQIGLRSKAAKRNGEPVHPVRQWRHDRNMTADELATLVGLRTSGCVLRLERGQHIGSETYDAVMRFTGMSIPEPTP